MTLLSTIKHLFVFGSDERGVRRVTSNVLFAAAAVTLIAGDLSMGESVRVVAEETHSVDER